jgi:hypothetical protein
LCVSEIINASAKELQKFKPQNNYNNNNNFKNLSCTPFFALNEAHSALHRNYAESLIEIRQLIFERIVFQASSRVARFVFTQ